MSLIISSENEIKWIEGEHRRQTWYLRLTILSFMLLIYAFALRILPENVNEPIYWVAFLFAFLAFMVSALMHTKSRRYIAIIDELFEERRHGETSSLKDLMRKNEG